MRKRDRKCINLCSAPLCMGMQAKAPKSTLGAMGASQPRQLSIHGSHPRLGGGRAGIQPMRLKEQLTPDTQGTIANLLGRPGQMELRVL